MLRKNVLRELLKFVMESNREGIRIVIELRKDIQPEVILNQLFKLTSLQNNFWCEFNCFSK